MTSPTSDGRAVMPCIHRGVLRCWACMTGNCYAEPALHQWWDGDDVDHAATTGQPAPSGWCGCVFCGAPAVERAETAGDASGSGTVYPPSARKSLSDPLRADSGPSERLRRAAALLDERAAAATPGPWHPEHSLHPDRHVQAVFVECGGEQCGHDGFGHQDGTCAIGAMHRPDDNQWLLLADPRLGPLLAAWLRAEAQAADMTGRVLALTSTREALALADHILAGDDQ